MLLAPWMGLAAGAHVLVLVRKAWHIIAAASSYLQASHIQPCTGRHF